jgi:hypothetical protein
MNRPDFAPVRPSPRARLGPRPGGNWREISEAKALFFAGAALAALDPVARSDPPWVGAWRRRLAVKSAAAVAQTLLARREDSAALRDAVALARPGQALGSAGRVYAAFRALADRHDPLRPERLAAADLQSPLDPRFGRAGSGAATAAPSAHRPSSAR